MGHSSAVAAGDPDLRRVSVVGTSCCGKTTFAAALGQAVGQTHVSLDALYWGPGWTAADPDAFHAAVTAAAAADRWIIDGNYTRARPIVWARATAVVWLDLPFRTVWRRALIRTTCRVAGRQRLFNGNRETFRRGFLSIDGIPWWVLRTFRHNRREYGRLLAAPEHAHLDVVRLRTTEEVYAFLNHRQYDS